MNLCINLQVKYIILTSPATYTLKLTGQDGKKTRQTFKISGEKAIQPSQAQNLLLGRAVEVNEKWIQLDLNDQDAEGNYRRMTFHENYGYDLCEALKHYKGKQQQVYLEANPRFKTVNLCLNSTAYKWS